LVVRGKGEEGDLAGGSVGAPQQLSVVHDAGADAGPHSDDGERAQVLGSPLPLLTYGSEVDVVVEDDLGAECLLQGCAEVERPALSDVPGVVHGGAVGGDDAGDGHPHDGRYTRREGGAGGDPPHKGHHLPCDRAAANRRGRFTGLGQHPPTRVSQRDADVAAADVHADPDAGPVRHLVQGG
jgi:hypothetical protein